LDAIAAIDAQELRDKLLYCAAETMFDVNKNTLQQRHQGKTHSNATEAEDRKLLSSQQERQLVQYIRKTHWVQYTTYRKHHKILRSGCRQMEA
jgi:hypothetical protein